MAAESAASVMTPGLDAGVLQLIRLWSGSCAREGNRHCRCLVTTTGYDFCNHWKWVTGYSLTTVDTWSLVAGYWQWVQCYSRVCHPGDKLFVLCDGLVCHLHGVNKVALVVPDDDVLHSDLLTKHHDSPLAGHLGLYRMTHVLATHYWWQGMYHDCRWHVHACKVCQVIKVSTQKPLGL